MNLNACFCVCMSWYQRIEMLIAKVKATQEREVPELMRRLAAVEAFQAVGEEVGLPNVRRTTHELRACFILNMI